MHDVFALKNPEVFDKEIFSIENFEWALITVESRLSYINWEALLIPMYDLISYGVNKNNRLRTFNAEKDDDKMTINIKAIDNFNKGSELYDTPIFSNEQLLISNGRIALDSSKDCLSISLSFSQRKEDSLCKKREEIFSNYFMFDETHIDLM